MTDRHTTTKIEQAALDEAIAYLTDEKYRKKIDGKLDYFHHEEMFNRVLEAAKEAQQLRAENERLRRPLDCQVVTGDKGKIG